MKARHYKPWLTIDYTVTLQFANRCANASIFCFADQPTSALW